MQDARFEDGGESALKLAALDAADLEVISALAQDAVFPASEISWNPAQRRFALLINRFRWEDKKKPPRHVVDPSNGCNRCCPPRMF